MIYLDAATVRPLLAMREAIEQVERAFRDRAQGLAFDVARERTRMPGGPHLNVMQGGSVALGLVGLKAYYVLPTGHTSMLTLIDKASGKLQALIEAHDLGQVRTGATTGVAIRHLARQDAGVVAMFGSGRQAGAQLEAACAVRDVKEAIVYSRDPAKLASFCERMSGVVGIRVRPAESPQQAVEAADIVITITRGGGPVFDGRWLRPGTLVVAAGVNAIDRCEIDVATVRRSRLVVDSRETAQRESGDLLAAYEQGHVHWDTTPDLGEVITGSARPPRDGTDTVLFESHGMALQDIYCGAHVLATARARGLGSPVAP